MSRPLVQTKWCVLEPDSEAVTPFEELSEALDYVKLRYQERVLGVLYYRGEYSWMAFVPRDKGFTDTNLVRGFDMDRDVMRVTVGKVRRKRKVTPNGTTQT